VFDLLLPNSLLERGDTLVSDAVSAILVLVAAFAMFLFARRTHRAIHVLIALVIGSIVGAAIGYVWVIWMDLDGELSINAIARIWHDESRWTPGSRERWLAVSTIVGMFLSWLSLRLVMPFARPRS
jgi:membrane protein YqaA with SNARE-associated domain